jgi:DNA polymerase III subunit delta'
VSGFETVPEQHEAKRLLAAALKAANVGGQAADVQPDGPGRRSRLPEEGPAHAYLFHGPAGVGKRELARRFAAELLGDHARVERGSHPDLYLLEPLGEQIRIDDVRELRRDLHMRPFEGERRVYLVFGADSLNEDAADALLKDLEEPPPYAVVVLVAERLGPLPETIRSRCQLVPFRRLTEPAVRQAIREHAPDLGEEELTTLARVAGGRLGRALQLLDPAAAARRETLIGVARAVYTEPAFEPADGAESLLAGIDERGLEARAAAEVQVESLELTGREADQRIRRAQRGAEREELLALLEELESWYRDLVVVAAGAEAAAVHVDRLEELRTDATRERMHAAEEACELVRAAWRQAEELQVSTPLALEALLIRLRGELGATAAVA